MVKVSLKRMKNKSRNGLYYYVKEKGYRGQYFKVDPKNLIQTEEVIHYYVRKHINKEKISYKKTFESHKVKKQKQLKENLSQKTIDSQIEKGHNKIKIVNATNATNNRIYKKSQELISKQTKDPEIRKRLALQTQQEKYKEKITHYVYFYNEDNKKILHSKVFDRTTYNVINELKKKLIIDEYIDEDDEYSSVPIDKLKLIGHKAIKPIGEGKIKRIDIEVELRK